MSWKISVQDFNTTIFGCFRKQWYPQIIHFNRVFHYKPSILGYLYFWKPPFASITILGGEKKQKNGTFWKPSRQWPYHHDSQNVTQILSHPNHDAHNHNDQCYLHQGLGKKQISSLHQDLPLFFWGRREKGAWENFRVLSKDICLMSYCRRFMFWTNIKCIYLHVGFNFLFESTYTHLHTDDTYHTHTNIHTNIQLCRYMYIYIFCTHIEYTKFVYI